MDRHTLTSFNDRNSFSLCDAEFIDAWRNNQRHWLIIPLRKTTPYLPETGQRLGYEGQRLGYEGQRLGYEAR